MTATTTANRYNPERYRRTKARQRANPLGYTPGVQIFRLIGRYGYLTPPQLHRLLGYSQKSATFISHWLTVLKDAGLVHDENWLQLARTGRGVQAWTFTPKGRTTLLDELGFTEATLPRIHHRRILSLQKLEHTLATQDALIACELLSRQTGLDIGTFLTDEQCHRMPVTMTLPDGRRTDLVPDGFVTYELPNMIVPLCLEVDRGVENQEKWRGKIRAYIFAAQGSPSPYEQTFGVRSMRVLIVVQPKLRLEAKSADARLEDLMRWTEAELAELGFRSWGKIFFFTSLNPATTDPRLFFGAPHWRRPFVTDKVPALEGVL